MMLVILMSIKGIAHIFFFFCKSHILGYDGVYFGRRGLETFVLVEIGAFFYI